MFKFEENCVDIELFVSAVNWNKNGGIPVRTILTSPSLPLQDVFVMFVLMMSKPFKELNEVFTNSEQRFASFTKIW